MRPFDTQRWGFIVFAAVSLILREGSAATVGEALPAPPFERYAVNPGFLGKPAPVDLTTDKHAPRFRTVLRTGAAAGPNFADHYTIVTWGCGSSCQNHAIVDAASGRVYMVPFATALGLAFRRDSRLLVADPAERCATSERLGPDIETLYIWDGQTLAQVGSIRAVAPCGKLPNISLNPDAPRRAYGPSFVAPVSFVR
jgi:hypothetical protein